MYLVEKFELQLSFQFDYSKSVICNNDFRLNIFVSKLSINCLFIS